MNNSLFKVARKVLEPLWVKATLRGSVCWGPKRANNPYSGRNMLLSLNKEVVILSEGRQGRAIMHEFRETSNTVLGRRVSQMLTGAGLLFIKAESRLAKTPEMIAQEIMLTSDAMWYCPKCKQGGAIDITSDTDHQAALKKAYQKHQEVSLDCEVANIKIYLLIDNRMTELKDLHQIAGAKKA